MAAIVAVGIREYFDEVADSIRDRALELLRGGPEGLATWNRRRAESDDLSGAHLSGAHLSALHLSGANLSKADLSRANLSEANLSKADLSKADLRGAKLSAANVSGAKLAAANVNAADLRKADLSGADLSGANLSGANLSGADLSEAALSEANLSGADLTGADLTRADLSEAHLVYAHLDRIRLVDTILTHASLSGTSFISVDLGAVCRAEGLRHHGPSNVDYRSIVLSAHEPNLKAFLRATGMPELFIEYMVSCAQALTTSERKLLLQSTFISYGGPDEPFAIKLNQALIDQGVATFLFAKDAEPGARLSRVMHDGVRKYERVILICSKASLDRRGVLNEIQETLDREAADGGAECIIPIRLDDYVFGDWAPKNRQLAIAIRGRVVADFTDPEEFGTGVGRLVRALMKAKP